MQKHGKGQEVQMGLSFNSYSLTFIYLFILAVGEYKGWKYEVVIDAVVVRLFCTAQEEIFIFTAGSDKRRVSNLKRSLSHCVIDY